MIDFCSNHAFGLSSEEKNHSLYIKFGVTSVCKDTNYFGYMVACCGFFSVWTMLACVFIFLLLSSMGFDDEGLIFLEYEFFISGDSKWNWR